ncbi:MAG: hypothetical protein H6Q13_1, partial [Bacteroidetes bacterium]|nr:hypothetical protein [Bacteroidota bacterium]
MKHQRKSLLVTAAVFVFVLAL